MSDKADFASANTSTSTEESTTTTTTTTTTTAAADQDTIKYELPTYSEAYHGFDGGHIEGPSSRRGAGASAGHLSEQALHEGIRSARSSSGFHFEGQLSNEYRPPPVLRYTPHNQEGSGYLLTDGKHSSWTIMMRQTGERVVGTDGSVEQHIAYDLFDEDEQLAYTVWRVNELKSAAAAAASTATTNTAANAVSSATSSVNSWLSAAMRRGKAATAAPATAAATQSSAILDGYVQHIMQRADHGCPSLDPFHGASPLWQAVLDLADLETAVRNMYDTVAISTALSTESRRAFGSSLKCGFRTAVLSDAGESEARLARAALRKDMDINHLRVVAIGSASGAKCQQRGCPCPDRFVVDQKTAKYAMVGNLSRPVDARRAAAVFKNGYLRLTLPFA
ncbi:hypothetical protein GQ42DRAFT_159042 [Ramicandelaber brevisporus]|nr:hypothetical protein GQ42DRAFT_159042 [Ramicandelaber brevisporus]